jgi:hypothetical protein
MRAPSGRLRAAGARMLPPLLLALLPWLFFGPLWWGDAASRRYLPEGDFSSQYYPMRAYAAERLARGQLPLWNPYALGGQPGLADIQAGTLYPPQSLQSLAVGGQLTYAGLELQVPLHVALAAVGTYLLAWRLTRSRWGGLAAGLAFSLGGYLTSFPVQQLTILCTVAWLPWLLLVVERLAGGHRPLRWVAALAVLTAMAALAGHPQTALMVAYVVAAYALWRLWRRPRRWRLLGYAAAGAALGMALGALQLLPTLEFIGHSTRASLSIDATSEGFGLHELMGALYPGYFGGTPQYAGVATLVLALVAVAALPWRRVAFWVITATAGLLLSFGGATALYYLTYILLPGFGASRNQERAILLPAVALAVLAGFGAAALADGRRVGRERAGALARWLWWATGAALLLGAALYGGTRLPPPASGVNLFGGMLKQHLWLVLGLAAPAILLLLRARGRLPAWVPAGALAALVGINLFVVNYPFNLGDAPAAVTLPSMGAAAALRWSLAPGARLSSGGLLPEGPSVGMLYDLPDTSGNTPLQLATYSGFVSGVPEWRRWQLLAVSHVVLPPGAQPAPGLEPVLGTLANLYRIAQPAAPVRLVHAATVAAGTAVWAALADPAFDPAATAVVAAPPLALAPATASEAARVLLWRAEEIDVEVSASAPALLVVAQVAYPGWRAVVDGRAATWQTADGLFVAVPLAAGRHDIRLVYRPASIMLGAAISFTAVAALLVLASQPKRLLRWLREP